MGRRYSVNRNTFNIPNRNGYDVSVFETNQCRCGDDSCVADDAADNAAVVVLLQTGMLMNTCPA